MLKYRASVAYNAEVFLIQCADLMKGFMAVDENFKVILKPLGTEHDTKGHSHVSLLPLVFLIQRQAHVAFDLFTRAQSYQAWLLARPGIECALIIGKWVDDPNNATIWRNRVHDIKRYRATYEGAALQSKSLANSDKIQSVLKKLNDFFSHANHSYYERHMKIFDLNADQVTLQIDYTDDGLTQEAHALAFLHLILVIQQDIADMCARLFGHAVQLGTNTQGLRDRFSARLQRLVERKPDAKTILDEMGAWVASES